MSLSDSAGPPRHIGGYQVVRELGSGAMGRVYEVRHPEIPRPLALKLMRGELAEAEDLLRFRREAELLARIRHPNVVTIHALDKAGQGVYLVTDLVPGDDLQSLLRRRRFDPARAARIVRDLADGLTAIHAQGILHRDLKPANVILREDGVPVLLDFGLARDVTGERLTQTGALLGTPAFMAPEQAKGATEDALDPRTDVYGLGGILYALLAGRPPFTGATLVGVLGDVLNSEPSWDFDGSDPPPNLLAICARAMSKRAQDRHPTAAALRDALDQFLAGDAPEPAPSRRAPLLLALGATLGVLAAAAGVAVATRSTDPPPIAPAPPTRKSRRAAPDPSPVDPAKLLERVVQLPAGPARVAGYLELERTLGEQTRLRRRLRRGLRRLHEAPLWQAPAAKRSPGDTRGLFVSDERFLVLSENLNKITAVDLWNLEGPLRTWRSEGAPVRVMCLDGRGGFLFAGDGGTLFHVPDLEQPKARVVWRLPKGTRPSPDEVLASILSLTVVAPGPLVAVGGRFREVFLVDASTGETTLRIGGHRRPVGTLCASPDGRYLTTATWGHSNEGAGIRSFDLRRGGKIVSAEFAGYTTCTTWTRGTRLLVAGLDGTLHVFDASLQKPKVGPLLGHMDSSVPKLATRLPIAHNGSIVQAVFFGEDRVASVSRSRPSHRAYERNELRVWSLRSRREVRRVRILKAMTASLSVAPNGRLLLVGLRGGLEMWSVGAD